ncbi:P-loop containing nucleoside triphosphate hydrolase protein [Fomitopsis serialis]|uniref:P-loop containing nucleoside triphosphate hydrolase protein n=1 Tax=Fomitopsis serialis TaxID=139415 RepID=UPI0020077D5F|nr:P-loop containing nucleoside triphosphate hydrolase protein [Neoantrodia serialis]KAH9938420.1 P-loop containing nucleoside triphosphate hydrolase protein [Neoantrodia serialis]
MEREQDFSMASASASPEAASPPTIWPVHIEVRVAPTATSRFDTIRNAVHTYITSSFSHLYLPSVITGWDDVALLASSVSESLHPSPPAHPPRFPLSELHCRSMSTSHPTRMRSRNSRAEMDGEMERNHGASVCELPALAWEGLWESLIYSDDIKSKLLDYIYATVIFSDADVDFNVVSWNRVVLLHGPPGTGKTSLCRALAKSFQSAYHTDMRIHDCSRSTPILCSLAGSLSRASSCNGFQQRMEMVEDEDTFVIVLIDEVESLTAARAGAMAGTEPSDALRVVNALLTQLDKLKHKKNVLVMSTSNLAKAIDSAFVDRADIVQYVDLPPREAIYEILGTCLRELVTKGIVAEVDVPSLAQAQLYERTAGFLQTSSLAAALPPHPSTSQPASQAASRSLSQQANEHAADSRERSKHVALKLLTLAEKCKNQGMSGRSLRRLPVLAHARHIGTLPMPSRSAVQINGATKTKRNGLASEKKGTGSAVEVWLDAMERVIDSQALERERFER